MKKLIPILFLLALIQACGNDEPDDLITPEEGCGITQTDALGPYFVTGTPELGNLNNQNFEGTPMKMSGYVYGGETQETPITNAKIEIWHTDNDGLYHPEGAGDVSDYSENEIALRGYVLTDENGYYSFESIYPGLYPGRARHIHFKITASGYESLVTQSYFKGGDRLESDFGAKTANACRIIEYTLTDGAQIGEMDFNLEIK